MFGKIDEITDKRIANARMYDRALVDLKEFLTIPPRRKKIRHVYHMYMFLAKYRDKLLKYLIDSGIEAKVHYPIPVHLQKASLNQKIPFGRTTLQKTEAQCKSLITLPVHQHLSEEQINFVIDKVKEFYKKQLWK